MTTRRTCLSCPTETVLWQIFPDYRNSQTSPCLFCIFPDISLTKFEFQDTFQVSRFSRKSGNAVSKQSSMNAVLFLMVRWNCVSVGVELLVERSKCVQTIHPASSLHDNDMDGSGLLVQHPLNHLATHCPTDYTQVSEFIKQDAYFLKYQNVYKEVVYGPPCTRLK